MNLPTRKELNAYDMQPIMDLFNPVPEVAFINEPAGVNHYRLLRWIGTQSKVISDIGTYMGFSAGCLGYNGATVFTYDTDFSKVHFKNKPHNIALIDADNENGFIERIINTNVILVDTWHEGKMEQDIYNYLLLIGWKGVLIYDDIYYNDAMKLFWASITHPGKVDATYIGHATGTGIIEFI